MAHRPIFRPDLLRRPRPVDEELLAHTAGPEWGQDDDGGYLADLALKLAAHGGGESSAELALDLLLHQIVEQARRETRASGAAIALVHGSEVICRATIGESAPDLGVRLSTRSGLSGACYQSRQIQRCDDTESDARVDAAACHHLEIRSMAVLPVLEGAELLGLLEVYAPRIAAFGEPEILTLLTLCRRIAEDVRHAAATLASAPAQVTRDLPAGPVKVEEIKLAVPSMADVPLPVADDRLLRAPRIREVPEEVRGEEMERETEAAQTGGPGSLPGRKIRRDYWTAVLTTIVLGLAMLLGWMIGRRASWQPAQEVVTAPSPKPKPAPETMEIEMEVPAEPAKTATAKPERRAQPKPAAKGITDAVTRSKIENASNSTGGLVIYEKGKVIYRSPSPSGGQSALPSNQAGNYLVQRVEPVYPEQAREQHIEGPVVLNATVGSDGLVEDVKTVSGDPQLVPAAADAVRQWRFRPYSPEGQPISFQTRVTVNFKLP